MAVKWLTSQQEDAVFLAGWSVTIMSKIENKTDTVVLKRTCTVNTRCFEQRAQNLPMTKKQQDSKKKPKVNRSMLERAKNKSGRKGHQW